MFENQDGTSLGGRRELELLAAPFVLLAFRTRQPSLVVFVAGWTALAFLTWSPAPRLAEAGTTQDQNAAAAAFLFGGGKGGGVLGDYNGDGLASVADVSSLVAGTSRPAPPHAGTSAGTTLAPCEDNCIEVAVGDASGVPGDVVRIPIVFRQGPDDGGDGGVDEIAAIAFTLATPGLELETCSDGDSDGLADAVELRPEIAETFRVVVENVPCRRDEGCPCPGGAALDNYVNVIVFGPKDLPPPGSGPVDIPILPDGELLALRLRIASSDAPALALHIFSEMDDPIATPKPAFGAFLSVGDDEAADQTANRESGRSQVRIIDGTVMLDPCSGDCDGLGTVSISEVQRCLNILRGAQPANACPNLDLDGAAESGPASSNPCVQSFLAGPGGCRRIAPAPTQTPTPIPFPGDLGFADVTVRVTDGSADENAPIAGATVKFDRFSLAWWSSGPFGGTAVTDEQGMAQFRVFVHDTDRFTFTAKADGFKMGTVVFGGATGLGGVELWYSDRRIDFRLLPE